MTVVQASQIEQILRDGLGNHLSPLASQALVDRFGSQQVNALLSQNNPQFEMEENLLELNEEVEEHRESDQQSHSSNKRKPSDQQQEEFEALEDKNTKDKKLETDVQQLEQELDEVGNQSNESIIIEEEANSEEVRGLKELDEKIEEAKKQNAALQEQLAAFDEDSSSSEEEVPQLRLPQIRLLNSTPNLGRIQNPQQQKQQQQVHMFSSPFSKK